MADIKEKTNSKDDNDPSKWSKSKKKRMRAKFSKMAKRQGKSATQKVDTNTTKQEENPTGTITSTPLNKEDSSGEQLKGSKEVTDTKHNNEEAKDKKLKKKKRKKSKEDMNRKETSGTVVADTNITNDEYQHQNDKKKQKLDDNNDDKNKSNASRFAFKVDEADHCETPLAAYRDIVDILDKLASSLNKSRSSLVIYDPYYCDGGIKKKLASIGFTNVINNNSDFYKDIKEKKIPEYDVLLTNPPYSGAHMGKLLKYCKEIATEEKKKPFLLLLPHYVYTKDYYQLMLGPKVSSSMFFLVPLKRYNYIPPTWVDTEKGSKALAGGRKQDTAPFPSFWYCHTDTSSDWLEDTFGKSGTVRPIHRSKLRYAKCTTDIPREFRGEFDPNNKRANPRARKRAAKMKREAATASRSGY